MLYAVIALAVLACVYIVLRQLVSAGYFNSYRTMFGTEYGSVIQDSFAKDKKAERLLYHTVFLFNKKQYAKALEELHALEHHPAAGGTEKGAIFFFEALCRDMQENNGDESAKRAEVIALYERALKENPSIDRAWSNVGLLYKAHGVPEKAKEAYEKAIELNPQNPFPYNNMAQLLIAQKHPGEAIPYALKAYELRDWLYQAAMALAVAYARTGQPELAEQYYERCAELGRSDMKKLREMMETE